jgi:cold shock CspA family protein
MADSYNKKEREKKRRKRKKDKQERKKQRKQEGSQAVEFMYVDENGHLTATPPDPSKKKEVKLENIMISTPKSEGESTPSYLKNGYVKFFNDEKGYGFVSDNESSADYYVHIENAYNEIRTNDKVSFEVGDGPKGLVALNVKLL